MERKGQRKWLISRPEVVGFPDVEIVGEDKVSICSLSLLSHRFCALSVCSLSLVFFYILYYLRAHGVLCWPSLFLIDWRGRIWVWVFVWWCRGVVWLCHFPLEKVYTFMKLLWATASNYKGWHLVSVISVSITGRGCRYFWRRVAFIIHFALIEILSVSSIAAMLVLWLNFTVYRGYFPNFCYCK